MWWWSGWVGLSQTRPIPRSPGLDNKNKFSTSSDIIKKYLSCLNQDRAEEKQKLLHRSRNHQILSNKYLTSVISRLKQHQTGEKNNMMIKSVHLGVPLCGKNSRNNFFPTLPFFKFEIDKTQKIRSWI